MEKFLKNMFSKKKIEKVGVVARTALVAGMVGVAASEGLTANATEANTNTIPSTEKTNINYENPVRQEMATITKEPFQFEKNKKKERVGGDPEGEGSLSAEGDPVNLTSAYFKTGTVEYKDQVAREQAKNAIRVFLKTVDLKFSKIIVTGYSSKERPTSLNKTLAEQRTEEGIRLVREILSEDYPGQDIVIETVVASDASVFDGLSQEQISSVQNIMSSDPEEFAKLVDAKQSIEINAVTKIPNFDQEEDYSNVSVVFGDRSKSMVDNLGAVEFLVYKVNQMRPKGEQINTITIEGGNNEQHLQTLIHYLESDEGKKSTGDMFLITDEGLNQLKDESGDAYTKRYNSEIARVLSLAGKREIIVKFLDPRENSFRYKIFNLRDKPFALRREARPSRIGLEDPKFTEEALNLGCFNNIERYEDKGDNAVKEEVTNDTRFNSLRGN